MTLREAVGHIVGFNTGLIDVVLVNLGQDGAQEYNQALQYTAKKAAAYVLKELVHSPDFKEGSYSVNFDRASLKRRAIELFRELGLDSEIENMGGSVKSVVL